MNLESEKMKVNEIQNGIRALRGSGARFLLIVEGPEGVELFTNEPADRIEMLGLLEVARIGCQS
tara:strand:- start:9847 stop:10038 length:192 start_codon:yes stop_codon:yes gene_type:complete